MQIVIDGILTHYEIVGDQPKTLVLLHGWKRSVNEWIPIAKQLSDRYKVVLLDLPGFGKTNRPEKTFSIYDYATFVEHFMEKLAINKAVVMGHSFGGRIGIIMGAKTKKVEKVEKLILVDAAGVEKRSITARIKIVGFKIAKLILPKQFVEILRQKLGSSDYKTAGIMRDIFVKVVNEDLTYLLTKISLSTFLIWGEKDIEVALWKTKLMRDLIPKARLRVVWDAGHSPYLEKPREFMEIINEYLNYD